MGVRVRTHYGERDYPQARDWYVTDERVLQLYVAQVNEHGVVDPEYVLTEFNRDSWEQVEFNPPLTALKLDEEEETEK